MENGFLHIDIIESKCTVKADGDGEGLAEWVAAAMLRNEEIERILRCAVLALDAYRRVNAAGN